MGKGRGRPGRRWLRVAVLVGLAGVPAVAWVVLRGASESRDPPDVVLGRIARHVDEVGACFRPAYLNERLDVVLPEVARYGARLVFSVWGAS